MLGIWYVRICCKRLKIFLFSCHNRSATLLFTSLKVILNVRNMERNYCRSSMMIQRLHCTWHSTFWLLKWMIIARERRFNWNEIPVVMTTLVFILHFELKKLMFSCSTLVANLVKFLGNKLYFSLRSVTKALFVGDEGFFSVFADYSWVCIFLSGQQNGRRRSRRYSKSSGSYLFSSLYSHCKSCDFRLWCTVVDFAC